jgi:hypothetical protein
VSRRRGVKQPIFIPIPQLSRRFTPSGSRPAGWRNDEGTVAGVKLNLVGQTCLLDQRLGETDSARVANAN